jgi:pyruvate dehydrogenase E2 component (dihydrolipoamide acetyltransferase)
VSVEQVLIPDVGAATDVEVVEICVGEGDTIRKDDCLVVLESEKASLEVPAPVEGTVNKLAVALGDKVEEGQLIVEIETDVAGEVQGEEQVEERENEDVSESEPVAATSTPEEATPAPSRTFEVKVPEVGEAKDVKVVEVLVSPGDDVTADDPLVVLESEKATMELPAGVAGHIKSVAVAEGEEVFEGTLIALLELEKGSAPAIPDAQPRAAARPQEEQPGKTEPVQRETEGVPEAVAGSASTVEEASSQETYAGPAVRKMARELGVELSRVKGSGAKGRIVKEDVDAYVRDRLAGASEEATAGIPAVPAVDFSRFGPVEIVPMSRIMKRGAANLHRSWLNIPHVTQHDEADVTDLEAFRKEHKDAGRERGVNLTPLPFLIKACCKALAEFPRFNASLSADGESFVLKKYYHIGMAVDTEEGLVVPVIRDADKKDIWQLAAEIQETAERAREGTLKLDELSGASFTISSQGVLGGTAFTPIINAPEVAILGVAKLMTRAVWDGNGFVPREMLPLSLSYDHRANNGADAAKFVTFIGRVLGDIRLLLL